MNFVKRAAHNLSVAHELSGLGSRRFVRFLEPLGSGIDEPDGVAREPQDEQIQGCIWPMDEAVGIGRDSAIVHVAHPASLSEYLCIEEERVVNRDNTVAFERLKLQLPESRVRAHYVKARVKVRQYPNGTLAVFHGPKRLARYNEKGDLLDATNTVKIAA